MRQWMGVVLLGTAMTLTGCQSLQNMMPGHEKTSPQETLVKRKVAFPADTYAKLEKKGTATIKGRLAYTTSQGKKIYGSDETISIAPVTIYSAEAADAALAGRHIEPADPRARAYTHYTKTNNQGYFVAHGLPSGVFYVTGSVLLANGQARSPIIIKQVEIGAGQTRNVDLSR